MKNCSPLGCWQHGPGSIFGIAYPKGGIVDFIVEAFAGPHDFANGLTWYDANGNAIRFTGIKNTVREWTTNYTTSLVFALPFAAAAILDQTNALPAILTKRKK